MIAETIEFDHGIKAEIHWDYDAVHANPRLDSDWNMGTMICAHRRYDLGDEDKKFESWAHLVSYISEKEKLEVYCNVCNREVVCDEQYDDYEDWYHAGENVNDELTEDDYLCEGVKIIPVEDDNFVIMPLYLYDHSGISMSTSDFLSFDPGGWDSGLVGFIYTTRQRMESAGLLESQDNEYSWQPKAREVLNGEVETYDLYLRGEVYGYVVIDSDGDELESCWGYLGDEYVTMEAKDTAKYYVDELDDVEASAKLPIVGNE